MIETEREPKILAALGRFPGVALLDARQIGKTTLARRIAAAKPGAVFLDLERPSDAAKLTEPELFLGPLADRLAFVSVHSGAKWCILTPCQSPKNWSAKA